MFWSISQWILNGTTTNHDMDHYKWWHESSQITTNHHKFTMTWITTNHKSLQITTNHDINHHEPWQKPAQSMTWTIMMTQKELCIKPYGFLVKCWRRSAKGQANFWWCFSSILKPIFHIWHFKRELFYSSCSDVVRLKDRTYQQHNN